MVARPRLIPPNPVRTDWHWHEPNWGSLPASTFMLADRRMEAENYLSSGYGIRLAFHSRRIGWVDLHKRAQVWQPARLKGIQVSNGEGAPFLAATQVFDLRPVPRKWIAPERTPNFESRFVSQKTILLTCSGTVGRATLAHSAHEGMIVSHDLLRVEPIHDDWWGWIYAYLRAPRVRKMMTSAQYGHMIKHLEPEHLNELPILQIREDLRARFTEQALQIVELRNRAHTLVARAERTYASAFSSPSVDEAHDASFSIRASEMFATRRRLDAARYNPNALAIVQALKRGARSINTLAHLCRVTVPGRFKHIYGEEGVPYLDSADILEVAPDVTKFVLSLNEEERKEYLVEPNWLLIPCSGQVYGNIGQVVLSTDWHVGKVLSNHVLRVIPKPNADIRMGYLQCVLGHPTLGRPQIVCYAFGSSVPELAAEDTASALVPRLSAKIETAIADAMEDAARCRAEADTIENLVAGQADAVVSAFLEEDFTALAAV